MKLKRKKIVIGLLVGFILFTTFSISKNFFNKLNIQIVRAEDDDEGDDDEDERVPVINTSPSGNTSKKTEYKTIYEKLSDTITRITKTTTQFDSDGDGIFDEQDKNPAINDGYIVKDDNLNGVDDQYEKLT
jgi:hypothetical protein